MAAVLFSIDYGRLNERSMTIHGLQPDGSVIEERLQGVCLKDVLGYLDATDYSSITLKSRDGFAVEYLPVVAEEDTTILVVKVDGKEIWRMVLLSYRWLQGAGPGICGFGISRR